MHARSRDGGPGKVGAVRALVLLAGLAAGPGSPLRAQEAALPTIGEGDPARPFAVAGPSSSNSPAPDPEAMASIRDRYLNASGPRGFGAVALASIFGAPDTPAWRPQSIRTFFSEGWNEAWVAEPDVSGDAQQGWINAADGNFYRLYFFSYDFARGLARGGDGHTGSYTLYLPLSRRLEIVANIPFVTSQPTFSTGKQTFPGTPPSGSRNRPRSTGFGDLTISPRVMLHEQDNFTLIAQAAIQIPTGYRPAGAGQAILTPALQFWWNFGEGWVLRGGFNAGVGTNRQAGGTTLLSQLAVGKTLTPADVPLLGDFTIYLAANAFNDVSSSRTSATLTPGFRTHLGGGWYALGGIEVPVTGPRPFETNTIAWIMKTF